MKGHADGDRDRTLGGDARTSDRRGGRSAGGIEVEAMSRTALRLDLSTGSWLGDVSRRVPSATLRVDETVSVDGDGPPEPLGDESTEAGEDAGTVATVRVAGTDRDRIEAFGRQPRARRPRDGGRAPRRGPHAPGGRPRARVPPGDAGDRPADRVDGRGRRRARDRDGRRRPGPDRGVRSAARRRAHYSPSSACHESCGSRAAPT